MNQNTFFTEQDTIPAIVVSVDDPECRGRVKVQRLDQSEISVDQLPWIYIHNQEHFSQIFAKDGSSIGASPHVLIPGVWVQVSKTYSDHQTTSGRGSIATVGTQ